LFFSVRPFEAAIKGPNCKKSVFFKAKIVKPKKRLFIWVEYVFCSLFRETCFSRAYLEHSRLCDMVILLQKWQFNNFMGSAVYTHTHKLHQLRQSTRLAAASLSSSSSPSEPPSALSQALKEEHAPEIEKNRKKQSIAICGNANETN
jgi:hypothetical protein